MPVIPYRVTLGTPRINALIYGRPGSGKTTLAASAADHPDMAPILVANFEGGLLSVAGRGDVDAVDIRTMEQMDDIFWGLRNRTPGFEHYKTLIVDSGSEMQTLALEEAVREDITAQRKKGKGLERTIDDIELQNYGKSGAQLARMMRWFRDLPVNVIITALPKFVFASGGNERTSAPIEVFPSFTNRLATQIMGYVDFVWYLYEEGGTRQMLTRDTGSYRAKTRGFNFNIALGSPHPNPWLPNLYNLLMSSESVPIGQWQAPTYLTPIPEPAAVTITQIQAEVGAEDFNAPVVVDQNGSLVNPMTPTDQLPAYLSEAEAAQVVLAETA